MNFYVEMADKDTGELLYRNKATYACNFVSNDTGRKFISKIIDSCLRGVRQSEHKNINLSISFCEPKENEFVELIPFTD